MGEITAGVSQPGPPDLYQIGTHDERARVRAILHEQLDYWRKRVTERTDELDGQRCQVRLELTESILNYVLLGTDPRKS